MPVKYKCPKCERRYVEWGAEKYGFKCPHCVQEELVRLGAVEQSSSRQTSMKRRLRRPAPQPVPDEEAEMLEVVEAPAPEDVDEEEEELEEEEEVQVGVGAAAVPSTEEDADTDAEPAADETLIEGEEDMEIGGGFEEGGNEELPDEMELEDR
ncbi:MAG TPA: hypothetical protein PKI11_05595 [Candidatus Hydrogenedentes bacterium]|nr:hypothetical protein [Candidatus Hydrogenedentota bacterium]